MTQTILRHALQGSVIGLVLFVGVGLLFAIPNPVTDAASAYLPLPIARPVEEAVEASLAGPGAVQVSKASVHQPALGIEPAAAEAGPSQLDPRVSTSPLGQQPVSAAAVVDQLTQEEAVVPDNEAVAMEDPPAAVPSSLRRVALGANGTVPGRVVVEVEGNPPAVGYTVTFSLDGQVVAQAVTNEEGRFQVQGIQAGLYSVVVSNVSVTVAYVVEVLSVGPQPVAAKQVAYAMEASSNEGPADVPTELLFSVPPDGGPPGPGQDEFGVAGGVMGGGTGGGGGGGEMGGLGSLLGLAGLAGLAGISDGDGGMMITREIIASPPYP